MVLVIFDDSEHFIIFKDPNNLPSIRFYDLSHVYPLESNQLYVSLVSVLICFRILESCKMHKLCADVCPPILGILSSRNTFDTVSKVHIEALIP